MKNRKWLKILIVLFAAVILGVVFTVGTKDGNGDADTDVLLAEAAESDTLAYAEEETSAESGDTGEVLKETKTAEVTEDSISETATEAQTTSENRICVHVCGCVVNPGVYYFPDNSRVHQAVEAAGGFKENAAGEYINLADYIIDGEQIYVPSHEDIQSGKYTLPASMAVSALEASGSQADDGLVNINTASAEELMTLPGIGQVKADAIINYRESNGMFNSTEDIMNVSGIAESSYEQIKNFIKV